MSEAAGSPTVVAVSGHLVDTPDRPGPRFPQGEVPRVTEEIRSALEQWNVGPSTTVVSGGARGADILVAEEALARGARVLLCLALPPDEFETQSVVLPGTDWSSRFRSLLSKATEVRVLDDAAGGGAAGSGDDNVFARTNLWMLEIVRALAGGPPYAVLVWNGQEGEGPGGTRHFVRELGYERPDPKVAVIDPTPRLYERRQPVDGDTPKKLLALDGGGIRGALTLEVLRVIEAGLRKRLGDGLVLADYFDYMAGTSTGAIIAAGLALGLTVDDLARHYHALGTTVFRKKLLPYRFRATYSAGPLTRALDDVLGEGRTLGDPQLRSLLLVVMHNTITDSPWPLSNCTRAKYNRADRYLLTQPDRNLDIPLTPLVRGSTAAPTFFPPQAIQVGSNEFVFQDGGITPFNNPALMLLLQATLPEYRLCWPVGEDRLLLVSVGTGAAAAVHPSLRGRDTHFLFNAKNLPAVFINGAAVSQDLVCRSLGRCRAGPQIDREIGSRSSGPGVAGKHLFTYLRYNADLSEAALTAKGYGLRQREKLRKLDAVSMLPDLQSLGRDVGATIDLDQHFAGFLG